MWIKSYSRRSRALGDPDSVDVVAHQERAILRMAADDGVELPREAMVREVGSGESLTERPRFAALLEEIRQLPPGGGTLYTTEVSRLSRAEAEESGRIKGILQRAGVKVRVIGHTFNLDDPSHSLFYDLLGAMSRYEHALYKQRTRQRRDEQFAQSKLRNGRVPWGYVQNKETNSIEPHPENFPLLVACCREALLWGVPTLSRRYGVPERVLHNALTNSLICGYPPARYGRSSTGATYQVAPRADWKRPEKPNLDYPHACTLAEWEAIQQAMEDRRKTGSKSVGTDGWCRDVVCFPVAPGPCVISAIGRRRVPDQPARGVYERRGPCVVMDGAHKPGPRLAYIERDRVHTAALEAMRAVFSDPARLVRMIEARREEAALTGSSGAAVRLQQLAEQIRLAEERFRRAVDDEYRESGLRAAALRATSDRIEGELKRLIDEDRSLREQILAEQQEQTGYELLPLIAAEFEPWWSVADEARRRLAVRLIIRRIVCRYEKARGGVGGIREVEKVELWPWLER